MKKPSPSIAKKTVPSKPPVTPRPKAPTKPGGTIATPTRVTKPGGTIKPGGSRS